MADFGGNSGLPYNPITDGAAVANTLVQTALHTAKSFGKGTFKEGDEIRVRVAFVYASTGTPNLTLTLRFTEEDGTSTDHIATAAMAAGGAGGRGIITFVGVVRNEGASGTIIWSLDTESNVAGLRDQVIVDAAVDSIDFTEEQDLEVTAEWSVAAAGNSIVAHQISISKLPII